MTPATTATIPLAASELSLPSQSGTNKLQLDYTKWGEKVTITAPSRARITKDSLLDRLGRPSGTPTTP